MKLSNNIMKIITSAVILLAVSFIPLPFSGEMLDNAELILYLLAYLIVGGEVVKGAMHGVIGGQIFDENFLMSIATIGAFLVGEYPEAVAVMLFYQIGELFQDYAVEKSRKSISELMDIRPDYAVVKENDGSLVKKNPEEVRIGEIIVVKPGEKVPLDGKLANGKGSLDVKALTGESLPKDVAEGDSIISGSISLSGVLEILVEKEFGESTVSKILDLVENASGKKAKTEKFITRFARYYTPVVVILALVIAILPPLITGGNWSNWIYRALTFLVISCPCALVISVPLSFFGGLGGASAKGILIKGSNYLEALAKCETIVFDKTGTLTKGIFRVNKIHAVDEVQTVNKLQVVKFDENELLKIACTAEYYSNHPISKSIREAFMQEDPAAYEEIGKMLRSENVEELAGYGIKAIWEIGTVLAGSARFLKNNNITFDENQTAGTVVYLALNGSYIGNILIEDVVKEDAASAVAGLKEMKVEHIVMLTGDRKLIADQVAKELGISEVHAELMPVDKVTHVETLLKNAKQQSTVAFVGDGINDAPVLARADVGIAMGGLGSDAAIEAADVVLMDDKPSGIVTAIRIAKKTVSIANQNIIFALGIKVLVLILAAIGLASMWAAVFADVGVAVLAILNALRALRVK